MEIPFITKPRPDTGLYNAKVGIWLFLASEVMLFGALFSSYILLRVGAPDGTWVHGLLNIPIGTFNTFVLITSSVTVVLGWASLQLGNFQKYKFYQAITILCALGFLGVKSFEYADKFKHYEVWLKTPVTIKHGDKEVQTDRLLGHIEYEGKHPYFWNTKRLAGTPEVKDKDQGDPLLPLTDRFAGYGVASADEVAALRRGLASDDGHERSRAANALGSMGRTAHRPTGCWRR